MGTIRKHETEQMRAAWKLGYVDAVAGSKLRTRSEFAGQPARNFRNYEDGYLTGSLEKRRAA
jgi:hypothetical protein